MKNRIIGALVALAILPAAAFAAPKTFSVYNDTGATLVALYGGPSASDDWGDNVLDRPVKNGETVTVTIGEGDGCLYDFRYEFNGKETYDEFKIDICKIDGDSFTIQ